MQIIDAHQHYWQLDMPFDYGWLQSSEHAPICRNYLPENLKPHLDQAGVSKSIFVQTQHNLEENRWALSLAEQHDWLVGVVGWVDLASPDVEDQLLEFKGNPQFVGVRHITQDEPDDDFIVRDDVLNGLHVLQKHGVPFDLLFYVKHLKHAQRLGRELTDLPMVIDHLAKPEIKAGNLDGWRNDLSSAAAFPNIYCKLSGMVTEANWQQWTVDDLRPYVEHALECFGPERCMFGSDWPVCELAASYEQVFDALTTVIAPLSDSEKASILGGTAARFYGLSLD